MDLPGGGLPAHVAHIGGTGAERVAVVRGHEKIVHRMAHSGLLRLDLPCDVRVKFCAGAAGRAAFFIGGGQLVGKGVLRGGMGGHAQLGEVPVQHLFQRVVGHRVGQAVDKHTVVGGLGHQGCALGDLVHPRL